MKQNPTTSIYTDDAGNIILQGAYRNINNFKKQMKNFDNAVKSNNHIAKYDAIDKSNGLAHRLKKQT